jgi:hypothetical protein
MKFLKFLFGFALLSCVKSNINVDKFIILINQTIEECRVLENATVEDALVLYTDDDFWPKTKEGECLLECFFEEIGIVRSKID